MALSVHGIGMYMTMAYMHMFSLLIQIDCGWTGGSLLVSMVRISASVLVMILGSVLGMLVGIHHGMVATGEAIGVVTGVAIGDMDGTVTTLLMDGVVPTMALDTITITDVPKPDILSVAAASLPTAEIRDSVPVER